MGTSHWESGWAPSPSPQPQNQKYLPGGQWLEETPRYRDFRFTAGLPLSLREGSVRQEMTPEGQDSEQLRWSVTGSPPAPCEAASCSAKKGSRGDPHCMWLPCLLQDSGTFSITLTTRKRVKGRPKPHFTGPRNEVRSLIKDEIIAPVEKGIKQLGTFLVKIRQKSYHFASWFLF